MPRVVPLFENDLVDAVIKFLLDVAKINILNLQNFLFFLWLVFLIIGIILFIRLHFGGVLLVVSPNNIRYFFSYSDVKNDAGENLQAVDEVEPPINGEHEDCELQDDVIILGVKVDVVPETSHGVGKVLGGEPDAVVL